MDEKWFPTINYLPTINGFPLIIMCPLITSNLNPCFCFCTTLISIASTSVIFLFKLDTSIIFLVKLHSSATIFFYLHQLYFNPLSLEVKRVVHLSSFLSLPSHSRSYTLLYRPSHSQFTLAYQIFSSI